MIRYLTMTRFAASDVLADMTRAIPLLLLLALGACDRGVASPGKPAGAIVVERRVEAPLPPKPVPDTPTIRFLELVGDMKLSPAERREVAELEARERAKDPAAEAKEEAELSGILAKYERATPVQQAKLRHDLRALLHFEQAKMTDPLPARLLAKHDPVLVEDAPRREVVTMADITALNASNRYIAKIAGVEVPDVTERPGEREELQKRYAADEGLRTALTRAGPRHATMVAALEGLPADKRAEVDKVIRANVRTPEDAANAARGAENAVLLAEQRKAQRARDAAAAADFQGWLQSRWQAQLYMARMDGVMRALDTENRHYPR